MLFESEEHLEASALALGESQHMDCKGDHTNIGSAQRICEYAY